MKKLKLNQRMDFATAALAIIIFGSTVAYIMIFLIQR